MQLFQFNESTKQINTQRSLDTFLAWQDSLSGGAITLVMSAFGRLLKRIGEQLSSRAGFVVLPAIDRYGAPLLASALLLELERVLEAHPSPNQVVVLCHTPHDELIKSALDSEALCTRLQAHAQSGVTVSWHYVVLDPSDGFKSEEPVRKFSAWSERSGSPHFWCSTSQGLFFGITDPRQIERLVLEERAKELQKRLGAIREEACHTILASLGGALQHTATHSPSSWLLLMLCIAADHPSKPTPAEALPGLHWGAKGWGREAGDGGGGWRDSSWVLAALAGLSRQSDANGPLIGRDPQNLLDQFALRESAFGIFCGLQTEKIGKEPPGDQYIIFALVNYERLIRTARNRCEHREHAQRLWHNTISAIIQSGEEWAYAMGQVRQQLTSTYPNQVTLPVSAWGNTVAGLTDGEATNLAKRLCDELPASAPLPGGSGAVRLIHALARLPQQRPPALTTKLQQVPGLASLLGILPARDHIELVLHCQRVVLAIRAKR